MTFRVWCLYSYLAYVSTYPVLCKTQNFQRDHGFVRRESILDHTDTVMNPDFGCVDFLWMAATEAALLLVL
jgi:hypothetical protein